MGRDLGHKEKNKEDEADYTSCSSHREMKEDIIFFA